MESAEVVSLNEKPLKQTVSVKVRCQRSSALFETWNPNQVLGLLRVRKTCRDLGHKRAILT